jgi:hypothetical protein
LAKQGKPDIFNTGQGGQLTSFALANVLRTNPHLHGRTGPPALPCDGLRAIFIL